MMLQFAYLWAFILMPLPILIRWFTNPHQETKTALHVPFLNRLSKLLGKQPDTGAVILGKSRLQKCLIVVVWICMVFALARPQYVGEPITKDLPGRDLLVAVDLSGSMETKDFKDSQGKKISRVDAVKNVLDDFLKKRKGDRVGLIFFGNAPFLQVPFTEDLDVCRSLLQEAQPKMAGTKTMIGDAIGKAVTIFDRSELKEKVLILLTDGNDTGSLVSPVKAAQIAHDKNIIIHVIGMGDPTTVGEEKLDQKTLDEIASTTGGKSYLAIDNDNLEKVYDEIDALTIRKVKTLSYRPVSEYYFWLLLIGLVLSLAYHSANYIHTISVSIKQKRLSVSTVLFTTVAVNLPSWGSYEWTHIKIAKLHFLRAEFLWLLIPASLLVWAILSRGDERRSWKNMIDPHLLTALLVSKKEKPHLKPVHLLSCLWLVGIISLSGPSWRYEKSPFAEEKSALVIALKVTPSMLTEDVQPSRLQRSVHKIHDILAKRSGAHTSLIAYAGSAHVVMPFTYDSSVIESFAAELSPEIMPKEGDEFASALKLAKKQLSDANKTGSILFISDGVNLEEAKQIKKSQTTGNSAPLILGMVDPALSLQEKDLLIKASSLLGSSITFVSPDERDVDTIVSQLERNLSNVSDVDGKQQRHDSGYWLTPVLCLIVLFWFRPGWVVTWE